MFCVFWMFIDDNMWWMKVIVKGFIFVEEFGGENNIFSMIFFMYCCGKINGNCGFDDYNCIRIYFYYVFNYWFYIRCIEIISFRIIVGWSGDDDIISIMVGFIFI